MRLSGFAHRTDYQQFVLDRIVQIRVGENLLKDVPDFLCRQLHLADHRRFVLDIIGKQILKSQFFGKQGNNLRKRSIAEVENPHLFLLVIQVKRQFSGASPASLGVLGDCSDGSIFFTCR